MQSKNYIASENINRKHFPTSRLRFSSHILKIILLLCAFAAVSEIRAATITVDRTDDTAAATACTAAASDCSLRGAFAYANVNSGTVISIPAGTYNLSLDELKVGTATNVSTTITGAGANSTTINQTVANRRVINLNLSLAANVVVNISGVRITGGNSPADNFGGGGLIGGAGNTLNLSNCVFENNSDTVSSTPKGGGIEWAGGGFLNIDNCTFNNNTAGSAASNLGVGGGVDYQLLNLGGAAGQGGLTITNSTFTNNKAGATIPITVSQLPALTDANVVKTYAFNVQYDATVLKYTGFDTTGTLSGSSGVVCGQPPADATNNRIVACNYTNVNEITGQRTLLKLNFTVIGKSGQQSALTFVGTSRQPNPFIFNTGDPQAATNNGNFTALGATAATVSLSGRVLTASGRGIQNVRLSLTDSNGEIRTATTTSFGYYRFDAVQAGETYILSAIGKHYTFSQPVQVLNINEETTEVNFIANSVKKMKVL